VWCALLHPAHYSHFHTSLQRPTPANSNPFLLHRVWYYSERTAFNRLAVYCYSMALSSFTSRWPAVLNASTKRLNYAECRQWWHYTTAGAWTQAAVSDTKDTGHFIRRTALDISILHCCAEMLGRQAASEVWPGSMDSCLTL